MQILTVHQTLEVFLLNFFKRNETAELCRRNQERLQGLKMD